MVSTKPLALAALASLLLQVSSYKLTAYKEKGCTGEVQQTIEDTKYGDFCQYFKDKAASIKVEGATSEEQWIFFNNWCGSDAQVGSFMGNGCMSMGNTKLKAVSNVIPQGGRKNKRAPAGTVKTWKNTDCSGSATDSACHVDNQVATLENDQCVNVKGKNVKSAMAIGVPTPPRNLDHAAEHRQARSLISEARAVEALKRANDISCDSSNGPDYKDALKVGDKWEGDNGAACCCHIPGGSNTRTSGSAKASINDNIRCPSDPSGMTPPASTCPLTCSSMRSYIYAIATQCKDSNGKTGGTASFNGDEKITLGHS
ncbi:hypothetical protein F4806DRAFT_498855 [Annulohypoxylon nitens]|nr:hypothetical protein F4806DRAFT_498855 [Annulohypoxylon nitens]